MNELGVELKNPRLKTLTLEDIQIFIKDRESYDRAVRDKNTGVPVNRRIIPVSVKASVDQHILELVGDMHLEKDVDQVTSEELWEWLKNRAHQQLVKSDQPKKVLFDKIRMGTSLKSAAARIDNLWRQWYEVRANNQEQHEFATAKGKKIFRTQMAAKLFPDKVRSRVQAKLEDADQLAQEIRDDDKKFYDYVRGVAEEVERVFLTQIDHPKRERSDTSGNDPGNNRPFKKRRLSNQPPGGNPNNSGGRSQFFGNRFEKYRKGNFFRNGHSQKS